MADFISQAMQAQLARRNIQIEEPEYIHQVAFTYQNLHGEYLELELDNNVRDGCLCGVPVNQIQEVHFMGPDLRGDRMTLYPRGNNQYRLGQGWKQIAKRVGFMAGQTVHLGAFSDEADLWFTMDYIY